MVENIRALILKFPGTNNDVETERALRVSGFSTKVLPVSLLDRDLFSEYSLIVIPGGFSYGDYVRAGKLAALELELKLGKSLHEYRDNGGLVLGICNGFQILLQLGLLPRGSLVNNVSKRFICRWVRLRIINNNSPFLRLLHEDIELPIAHAEGRFITNNGSGEELIKSGAVNFKYIDNVNGSECGIAGISDNTGRVLGLMPHPERFLYRDDHYNTYNYKNGKWGYGYYFFKSAFEYLLETNSDSQVN